MDLLIFDLWWMTYNVSLALLAIIFGMLLLKTKNSIAKLFFTILWLLFIPNTLYMVTDFYHLWDDWHLTTSFFDFLLTPIYTALAVLGVITFVISLRFFEKMLYKINIPKEIVPTILVITNFIIGFGVILGRVERANSWEVVTNIPRIIGDTVGVFSSYQLLLYVIAIGVFGNLLYFIFKKWFFKRKI